MANEEHLRILEKGKDAWNEFRSENPTVTPDLSGSHLDGFDFRRREGDWKSSLLSTPPYDLRGVNLSKASLIGANFSGSNLQNANLEDARLIGADFSLEAFRDSTGSHFFQSALLIGTNLSGSDLQGADLTYAVIDDVRFDHAFIGLTRFGNNDLSTAIGLDTVIHGGPSVIGIDTIYKSKGNIPEVFLRGCGVPDTFITFARSLVGAAIEYYSAFISYSSKNQNIAERLYSDLQAKSVRCWFAPEDLKIGDKFRQRIDEAIRLHDKLLLILSEDSISSAWVEQEVESALEREQRENRLVLFPVRIDDAVMNSDQAWAASLRRTRHIGDFSNWKDHDSYVKAFDRLLRDLKAEALNLKPR